MCADSFIHTSMQPKNAVTINSLVTVEDGYRIRVTGVNVSGLRSSGMKLGKAWQSKGTEPFRSANRTMAMPICSMVLSLPVTFASGMKVLGTSAPWNFCTHNVYHIVN